MRTRNRAGLGIIAVVAFLSGCGLDVELTSTPETVGIGSEVTHSIKVTNASVCPIDATQLIFYPHLSPEDEASIDEGFLGGQVTLAELCDIEASGLPDGFPPFAVDPGQLAAARERHGSASSPAQSAANLAGATLDCAAMVDSGGLGYFQCAVDPLGPGAMATVALQVPADELGTFRNFALADFFTDSFAEVCDGGERAGQECDASDDCPGGNCDPGICQGGSANGLGCEIDDDCDGGDCVDCETCQVAGVCTGGPDEGTACFHPDDCADSDTERVFCQCGIPVDCSVTNVVASVDTAPAMSPGGWMATIVALFGIGAFALRRRFSGA